MEDVSASFEGVWEPESWQNLSQLVLSNSVVWRTLGKFLNLEDLKSCRLVSKQFNRHILDDTPYRTRCCVVINCLQMNMDEFKNAQVKWRHMKVSSASKHLLLAENYDSNFSQFLLKLEEVETLSLKFEYDLGAWSESRMLNFFHNLLQKCNSLRELCAPFHPFTFMLLKSNAPMVSRLHVLKFEMNPQAFNPLSLEQLSFIGDPFTTSFVLHTFKMSSKASSPSYFFPTMQTSANLIWISNLLENNRSRLQTLELDFPICTTLSHKALKLTIDDEFPLLKSLKIRITEPWVDIIERVLKNQPLLEELDIAIFPQFPNRILDILEQRGKKLKRLRISTERLTEYSDKLTEVLSNMLLEEFSLDLFGSARRDLTSEFSAPILSKLPTSIQKIVLRGNSNYGKTDDIAKNLEPVHFPGSHLVNITVLNLSRCGYAVTDKTAEYICRNMILLQDLTLSYADSRLTDYGFTGILDLKSESQFSLSNLRGLKFLSLISCGNISDLTAIQGIKFLELRTLDLWNNQNITKNACIAMLHSNPSLEKFRPPANFPLDDHLKSLFKTICPRLKEILDYHGPHAKY